MHAPPTNPTPFERPVRWRRALILAALGPAAWALLFLARLRPEWTERVYARGVYPAIRSCQAWIQQASPVSLTELGILVLAGWIGWRCLRGLRQVLRRERRMRNLLAHGLAWSLAAGGVAGLTFQLAWGLNHARPTLATLIGLSTGPASSAELAGLLVDLEVRAVADRARLDSSPSDPESLRRAWARLGERLEWLTGKPIQPRSALASRLLTWAGLTGIYSPFTGEAHVNAELPLHARPFTAAHEVAHQRGIAREDEANFVAWLVCQQSLSAADRYSGQLLALSYALIAWHRVQPELARANFEGLHEPVRRDLAELWDFWSRRRTVLTNVAKQTNDLFLKGQGQAAGGRSYGRMVDLLIAYRRGGTE
jgi:Protein of unknown function (DUF3810)